MSIIGKGYFEDGPGAWCGTKISVRETEDGEIIYSLDLALPPVVDTKTLAWLFHSVLENVTNHRDMPEGAGPGLPALPREEARALQEQKFWLIYEYGEIKAPPFAACAHLSKAELEALVFDENRGCFDISEDVVEWLDESPALSAWLPAKDGSPFLVDPARYGQ